jgi:UDP-glucose:(heptosyl)LPS alpha-1,3-glucosyltransferase
VFNPRRKAMAEVERALLTGTRPPVLLCLSDYVKQHLVRYYPALKPDRVATLFNAVTLHHFDPRGEHDRLALREGRGVRPDDVVALIVAQDFERKGVPQAIEATRRVNAQRNASDPRLRLLVVGAGHPAAVEGDIIYAGTSGKIVLFYSAADFFVLPTRHDPCSLVVLEALAMGLPVISTRFNGACEIMTDGAHGFILSDPHDVDALAQAMQKMLDPQLRAKMSAACLELRPKLSYEHHLDRLIQIYQQCR